MNDEKEPGNEPANAAPNTSENIEVPKEKEAGGWRMPEPVFRKTSGYLPEGFEKRFPGMDPQADISTEEPVADVPAAQPGGYGHYGGTAPAKAPATAVPESRDVQPQPDLTEDFPSDAPNSEPPPAKTRSAAASIALTLLGIFAMIAFAIGFLIIVWYLFFYHPNDPQILN